MPKLILKMTDEGRQKYMQIAKELIDILMRKYKLTPFDCLLLLHVMLDSLEEALKDDYNIRAYRILENVAT